MPPILGNAIALLCVALLVAVCVRNLWKDAKSGGCGGCAGCGGGNACGGCPHCAGCHSVGRNAGTLPDVSALRLKKGARS